MKFTIFLTRDCNLRCNYCYEGTKEKLNMSFETADKVINFIDERVKNNENLKNKTVKIVLHGGEPLLNQGVLKYIVEKLESIDEYDIVFDMTTNGTILNSDILTTLKKIHNISVSIDGGHKVHDFNRVLKNGQGTFNIVKKNIEKMKSEGIKIRARGTYNSHTCSYLYDSVNNISHLGVECIVMLPDISDENWCNESFDTIFSQIKKIFGDDELKNRCEYISPIEIYDFGHQKGSCFGGMTEFAIDYNGDLYPCTMSVAHEEFLIGSLWTNYLNEEKIEQLLRLNRDNDICNGCSRIKYCTGNRCKILNKLDTGNFFVPNGVRCELEKLEIKKYNYIKELKNKNDVLR
ncbi:radical SAM protein [Acinetobacter sp. RIT592]|nr:radical SAM protein [Acinetobacter sp. RIT592]